MATAAGHRPVLLARSFLMLLLDEPGRWMQKLFSGFFCIARREGLKLRAVKTIVAVGGCPGAGPAGGPTLKPAASPLRSTLWSAARE